MVCSGAASQMAGAGKQWVLGKCRGSCEGYRWGESGHTPDNPGLGGPGQGLSMLPGHPMSCYLPTASVPITASPRSHQPRRQLCAEPTSRKGAGSVIKIPWLSVAAQGCQGGMEASGGYLLPVRDPST